MTNKICPICGKKFYSNHNTQRCCSKACRKIFLKQYRKQYKKLYQNKEDKARWDRKYYLKHKKEHNIKSKIYRQNHKNELKEYLKLYYQTHKKERQEYIHINKEKLNKKRRKYLKIKKKNDITFKLLANLRNRIRHAIKYNIKSNFTKILLGCTVDFFKKYLETRFKKGMEWNNYGKKGWVIDHIRPCSSFDLSNPEEQKKCFHYTNLQPLWEIDNLKKASTYDY